MVEIVIFGALQSALGIAIGFLLSRKVQFDQCACGSGILAWCKLRSAKTSESTSVDHDTCPEDNARASERSMASQGLDNTRLEGRLLRLENLCTEIAWAQNVAAETRADADPLLTWDEAARLLRGLNYDARQLQAQVASTPLLRTALLLVTQPATRIWVDGVFDLTHYGHYFFCLRARQLGTQLVVGVNDSRSVEKAKGTTPILTDEERVCMIRSCKFVDIVECDVPYVMDSAYLQTMIDKHQLSTVAHGDDPCFDAHGNDVYAEVKRRKMYRTIDRVTGTSTTELVGRMVTFVDRHYQVPQETRPGGVLVLPFGGSNLPRAASDSDLHKAKSYQMGDGDDDDDDQPPIAKRTMSLPVRKGSTDDASEEVEAVELPLAGAGSHRTDHDEPAEELIDSSWSFAASGTIFNEFLGACMRPPQDHQAICYMDGSWDLLNAGHINTLEESRRQAQEHLGKEVYLIVGVHSDVTAYQHYQDWPILNMMERVLAIMAVRGVDNVIMDARWSVTESFIAQLGIRLVLYATEPGWDEDRRLREERYAYPMSIGKYKEVERPPGGLSAAKVMDRIYAQRETYAAQLNKKKRKESAYYTNRFLSTPSSAGSLDSLRAFSTKSVL